MAADFAEFFSNNVLTSNKLWKAMIDGSKAEAFRDLVAARVVPFVSRASAVAGANLDPLTVKSLAVRAAAKLGDHVHVLHEYTDNTLALRETMTVQMQKVRLGICGHTCALSTGFCWCFYRRFRPLRRSSAVRCCAPLS